MFTAYGRLSLLAALRTAWSAAQARFSCSGVRVERLFPVDPGYPKLGDTDPANPDRGDFVLTLRFTIPQGPLLWDGPATEVELLEGGKSLYRTKIDPLRLSLHHASIQYVNLIYND